jgi:lipopolysaccharide export system permease protein
LAAASYQFNKKRIISPLAGNSMKILNRYIAWSLIKGWLLVLVVIVAIFGLLAFITELDRVNAAYGILDVLRYVAFTMPQRVLDLAPVIVLLGTLISLATLAKHNELTIIWSAGVTTAHFMRVLWLPILMLVIVLTLTAEFVAAQFYQRAEAERSLLRSGNANMITGRGLWSAQNGRFINVRSFRMGHIPENIDIYQFNEQRELISAIHASHAEIGGNRRWILFDVDSKTLENGRPVTHHIDQLEMSPLWSEQELPGLSLASAGLSLSALYSYANYLKTTSQPYQRYWLAFWIQALLPLTAAAMVLLAASISIGLGSARGHSFEIRIAIGALIGIVFYLVSPLIYTAGNLFALPSPFIATIPLLIVLVASGVLFSMRS